MAGRLFRRGGRPNHILIYVPVSATCGARGRSQIKTPLNVRGEQSLQLVRANPLQEVCTEAVFAAKTRKHEHGGAEASRHGEEGYLSILCITEN